TRTSVEFEPDLSGDQLLINGEAQSGQVLQRVTDQLDLVRSMAGISDSARVTSTNNFPMGTGIASSASAFAALAGAASRAAGLDLDVKSLSMLARRGSGSAARSIPAGFVVLHAEKSNEDAYAESFAGPEYWDLMDCICVVSRTHKPTGSTQGHQLAETSPLQAARVTDSTRRIRICREAILDKDFETLAEIAEADSNMMHAVMMTSNPQLLYWEPATLEIMHAVRRWRSEGLPVFYTIDAGPNVHIITLKDYRSQVIEKINQLGSITTILTSKPGYGVRFIDT
ncbi:MAG: diphosphomevalonate decarboxylase, partial [Gammaproteobacteria bacterium]|nr:diphosphomevalonate decarboxylase [Gammaproteobacteria bacterium]